MATETSIISRIAVHATAESTLPTFPSAGTNITTTAWGTAGFSTIGSRNFRSDDFDVSEDSWNFGTTAREHRTKAPLSFGTDDIILLGRETEDFEFKVYDMDVTLLAFGSDMTVASGVASHATSYTARTLCFEVHEQGIFVMPKAMIRFTDFEMGMVEDQVAMATATVTPLSVSSYAMGWYYEQY